MDEIIKRKAISDYTKEVFYSIYNKDKKIEKKDLLIISIIEKFLLKSIITIEESKAIASIIDTDFNKLFNEDGKIYLFRKFGVPFIVGCRDYKQIVLDKDVIKIMEIDVMKEVSEISRKLI